MTNRLLGVLLPWLSCAAIAQAPTTTTAVPLPGAAPGWTAQTIHQADAGVWYAHVAKVVPDYGQNEVIAADDKGRFLVLSVYSGNWTAHSCTPDGLWLAPTRPADVDPRVPSTELYAAGRAGSIHQIVRRSQPFARFTLESREIGHVGGEEFHAMLAADLLPASPGDELLAFAITGAIYRLAPEPAGDGFSRQKVAMVPGRVRDIVVVPGAAGAVPSVLGVSRSGDLLAMQLSEQGLTHRVLLHEDSGLGRITVSPTVPGVVYVTRDDGLLLRVQIEADGTATRTPMLATAQGLRGVAAGRFYADGREAVACYGYGKVVQMVTRNADGSFATEDLFAGAQQGHWLAVGELDGRNGTDELIATGFDGAVILLAREPGYGLPGIAVPKPAAGVGPADPNKRPLRLAARFSDRAAEELSPLRYQGGFETKSLVYETLVRRSADGRIAPGLAAAWRTEAGGKVFLFTLRAGATFHDGTPVTAEAVAEHFRRWVGLPEHDWLLCNRHIVSVRANGPRELRIELDEPWALLPDLCAINPTAVRGPGALSREGDFCKPMGSGAYMFVEAREGGRVLQYRRAGATAGRALELVRTEGDALDALLAGEVDAVFSSWQVPVDPTRAAALRRDARFTVVDGPGSSMWHLGLRWDRGVLQSLPHRQAIAAAIDRAELVRVVASGFGDPSTGFAAPSIVDWPQGKVAVAPAGVTFGAPLRLQPGAADDLLVRTVVGQLQRRGIPVEVLTKGADGDDWDLRFERTHGVPYDPFTTVVSRFRAPAAIANASRPAAAGVDPQLAALVQQMAAEPDEGQRASYYVRLQARLDELLPLVPLFAPRRIAVFTAGLPAPVLEHDMYTLDPAWLLLATAPR